MEHFNRRFVDAATAPRVQVTAPNSPFNWRPAGEGAQTPDDSHEETAPPAAPAAVNAFNWGPGGSALASVTTGAADTSKENTVATKPDTPPASGGRNIQRRLCQALAKAGDKPVARADIAKLLPDLNSTQISQALFNATGNSRAVRNAAGAFSITAAGRLWLEASDAPASDKPPAPKKRAQRQSKKAAAPAAKAARKKPKTRRAAVRVHRPSKPVRPVIDLRPSPDVITDKVAPLQSFRCAVDNTGGFTLTKNGQSIELDVAEHKDMLRYLDLVRGVEPEALPA